MEVIGSSAGLVPRNALAMTDNRWRQADFRVLICTVPILDYFRMADHPPGISVSLQVKHKKFIGNERLIGSSLR
jgi:hypothetical protein